MSEFIAVPLISKNGVRGKVLTTSRLLDERPQKTVIFESGREAVVQSKYLSLRTDGTFYLNQTVDPRPPDAGASSPPVPTSRSVDEEITSSITGKAKPGEVVVPRIEEQLEVSKRTVETGRVQVHKTVTHDSYTVDEPLIREKYEIQRVPVNRVVTEAEPPRVEGDTTIVPVYEEESVTTTRLVLREEIHMVKRRIEEHAPKSGVLRKERVEVTRTQTKTE